MTQMAFNSKDTYIACGNCKVKIFTGITLGETFWPREDKKATVDFLSKHKGEGHAVKYGSEDEQDFQKEMGYTGE